MAKIFSFNEKLNGSYINSVSGTLGANTNGVFKKTEKGIAWKGNGSNSYVTLSSQVNIGKIHTISVDLRYSDFSNINTLFSEDVNNTLRSASSNQYQYRINGTSYLLNHAELREGIFYNMVLTRNEKTLKLYINGDLQTTVTLSDGDNIDILFTYLFARTTSALFLNGYVSNINIWNEEYNQIEINNLYKDFLRSIGTGSSIYYKDYPNKSTDLSHVDGLVAAYNMIPSSGGILTDISGNGGNGTITECISTKKGMHGNGNGTNSKVQFSSPISNNLTIWSLAFVIDNYVNSGALDLLFGGASNKLIALERLTKFAFRDSNNDYYMWDGSGNTLDLPSTQLTNNQNTLILTSDGTDITLYFNGLNYGYITPLTTQLYISKLFQGYTSNLYTPEVDLNDFRLYNKVLSEKEIKHYYNQFVKTPIQVDFKYDGVGNFPKKFIPGTGEFEVKELTAQDSVLKELDTGIKYLECTTAGTCAIQNKYAYGKIGIYVNKGSTSNQIFISPISSKINWLGSGGKGYYFVLRSDEAIGFARRDDGSSVSLCLTGVDYFENNTWYKLNRERTKSGQFTWYIAGGAFGNLNTLIDPTGGSGTNPVTDNTYKENEYTVFDLDVGDKIAFFTQDNDIKQF